jgi:acetate kinase
MAAALGGLDALVYTGGVGENSSLIRLLASGGMRHLGVELDTAHNDAAADDADVSAQASSVAVLVIRSREDVEIARQVRALLVERS